MNSKKAREILGDTIKTDYGLHDLYSYTDWRVGDNSVTLDGLFTANELEAIAWWMRNTKKEGEENGK